MKAKLITWFSNSENAQTAIFCTIVFTVIASFITCIALILKYGTVINIA